MVTNLGFYFETQKEVRGGKFVWWGDTNPTLKKNQLLGGDLLNPKKGFDHFYAGQLAKYVPGGGLSQDKEGITIYRAFQVSATSSGNKVAFKATGWDDAPEVGMLIMLAPETATTEGESFSITNVDYDKEQEVFEVTLSAEADVSEGDIFVEAKGTEPAAKATPLVDYVNMWILADHDLLPTEGFGIKNGHYYLSGVSGCAAYIDRMQPLAPYILKQNKSLYDGVFEL